VLGADWDYKPLQVNPNESQFLETNKYTNAECARIYGPGMPEMLGYETGGSMTYTNIEQRGIDLLTFTCDPWLTWVERLLSELLPQPQYVKFERKALIRTDLLTRFKAHEIALRNEWEVVNEVRALEEQGPVPWGDEPTTAKTAPPVPVQMES
jgi:HK97 family phage portal protein